MTLSESDYEVVYRVVINREEQYSVWPADEPLPPGWLDAGKQGSKSQCLDHIETVWTDMRPLSLRQYLEATERQPAANASPVEEEADGEDDDLVRRLTTGDHPLEVSMRERTPQAFRDAIERDCVRVKFTETRGQTELGIRLDREATRLDGGDFDAGAGSVSLVGTLELDFVPVRCFATVNVADLKGSGRLEPLDAAAE